MKLNRFIAALLAVVISFTLVACGRKKKDEPTATTSPPATVALSETTTVPAAGDEPKSEAGGGTASATAAPQSPATTKAAAQAQPAPTAPPSSGLGKPSAVSNATSAEDLKDVDPATAAGSSYDTEVKVQTVTTQPVSTAEFPYVAPEQFESHILNCWSNFIVKDKVMIEASRLNQYLNYVSLPVKDSFFATNCNGLSARYGYDPTGKYVYLEVDWNYYINADQYASCKNRAATIVSGVTKSYTNTVDRIRAVHDYICSQTAYTLNVDGAYNCLFNGRCDCDGYTAAFQICMSLLGVPCKAFATDNHIFNLVQLNGSWYAVDATWDDQDSAGIIFARYFLLGRQSYSNYASLSSMLAPASYDCSRIGTVANEAVMRSAFGIPADAKDVQLGGSVNLNGQNYTDSITFIQGNYKYTVGISFSNGNS
ncbi:MAG: hypothetical protein K5836_00050 [Clostridiales bacterium]|nr:hypothetical protein [Clostridiales bacterium]